MQITFLNAAGTVLFVRDDMEQGNWTQEEYTVNMTFPFDANKAIQRGQRLYFRDPATNGIEVFEIRNVTNIEPEHYQQIIAEHIAVSELSDEHINTQEYYNVPPQTALAGVLTGTLWSVGTVSVGNTTQQATIRAQIAALGLNGNVDLTSRPIIYPDKMKNAGYTDFSGDYATLYSMTYTETATSETAVTLLMTPIQQNGNVLSQGALDSYVADLCKQGNTLAALKAADTKGLLMHFLAGTQIAAMDAIAVSAHDLSEAWETCISGAGSSAEISRGSVWQAVNTVAQNWNVYINPRITFSTAGAITGRYLDITHAEGTWRGVRLSIDKNMSDSSVVYDDSEVLTALYGYGGNVDVVQAGSDDKTEELTFASVVWTATADHPAKPNGQTYLEDPAKTALYGRNGRPRFGYYQNSNISDAEVLLQKTWETLKETSEPKISITGTVSDLYRLGYADQPLRLHDTVIVEIRQTGEKFQKEIIRLDVDLIDPTATRPEIGDYIPNIIYLEKETSDTASGGGGGGGGGRGMTALEAEQADIWTEFLKERDKIGMIIKRKGGEDEIDPEGIVLSINEDGGSHIKLKADTIDIQGIVEELTAYDLIIETLETYNTAVFNGEVTFNGGADFAGTDVNNITNLAADYIAADDVTTGTLTVAGSDATWQTTSITQYTLSNSHYFLYASSSGSTTPTNTETGRIVTGTSTVTLHYLGSAAT